MDSSNMEPVVIVKGLVVVVLMTRIVVVMQPDVAVLCGHSCGL